MMNQPNWDALGMRPTKPTSNLFLINLESYQDAVDWLKGALLETTGLLTKEAVLDPPAEVWRFYDAGGTFIANVKHETVEKILGLILWKHYDPA